MPLFISILNPPNPSLLEPLPPTDEREAFALYPNQIKDPHFWQELFRSALVAKEAQAWQLLHQQFQAQVRKWVKIKLTFYVHKAEIQTLVDDTFLKIEGTFTRHPQKFDDYPNLATLLGLLRLCAERVVQDYVTNLKQEPTCMDLDAATESPMTSDFDGALNLQDLWSELEHLVHDEQERLVVLYLFIEDHKPRHLYADYPYHFQSVDEINTIRERLKARLQRNLEFRRYLYFALA